MVCDLLRGRANTHTSMHYEYEKFNSFMTEILVQEIFKHECVVRTWVYCYQVQFILLILSLFGRFLLLSELEVNSCGRLIYDTTCFLLCFYFVMPLLKDCKCILSLFFLNLLDKSKFGSCICLDWFTSHGF